MVAIPLHVPMPTLRLCLQVLNLLLDARCIQLEQISHACTVMQLTGIAFLPHHHRHCFFLRCTWTPKLDRGQKGTRNNCKHRSIALAYIIVITQQKPHRRCDQPSYTTA